MAFAGETDGSVKRSWGSVGTASSEILYKLRTASAIPDLGIGTRGGQPAEGWREGVDRPRVARTVSQCATDSARGPKGVLPVALGERRHWDVTFLPIDGNKGLILPGCRLCRVVL